MRPAGYYVVFLATLEAIAVCHGYHQARRLSPQRAYTRHETKLAAQEAASWIAYEHPIPMMGIRPVVDFTDTKG